MNGASRPTFLLVGAARAGTTALVEGLRAHQDVFVTEPKEPHYFGMHGQQPSYRGPGDDRLVNGVAVTTEDAYRALFPSPSQFVAMGDGSVSTLYYHEHAIPEIRRIAPEARIVILLREPVARAYSGFQYQRARGLEECEDFLAAVADEPRRVAQNWHHLWHYTAMSKYAEGIEAFQNAFPPEQLGIWFYDDLNQDYEGTLAQVLDFIGVPPAVGDGAGVPRVNAGGAVRYPRAQRAIWWATRQRPVRAVARSVTSYRFREAARARMITRQEVPEDVRRALEPRFEEDLARLRMLLPAEVPDWLSRHQV